MSYSTGVLLLLLLESTFIFTILALLFHQRNNIGKAPFVMAFSTLTLLTFLAMGADIQAHLWGGLFFSVPKVVMFAPILAVYLLFYIVEGTLAAQRLIYGLLATSVALLYMAEMIYLQCSWSSFSLSAGLSGATLETLLTQAKTALISSAVSIVFVIFAMPIIFSSLVELKFKRFWAVLISMLSTELLICVPQWLIQLGSGTTPEWFSGEHLAQFAIDLYLGVLLGSYLKLTANENGPPAPRRALDLVFAFFGSYSRNKELEQDLSDWQNRHKLLLHNASEIIVIFDSSNKVREANLAANRLFGSRAKAGYDKLTAAFLDIQPPDFDFSGDSNGTMTFRCCCLPEKGSDVVKLFCSWSTMQLQNEKFRMLVARDITQEVKLTEEKRLLAEQLVHSQRLESLGVLAGGVAHDFNNYIHAILGHVDVAQLIGFREKAWTPKIQEHMDKIIAISEKAGELTKQLLGFARRGNYVETDFDPAVLFQSTFDLIGPRKLAAVQVSCTAPEKRFLIHGDQLQLQQVLVNIIINAIYAMDKNEADRLLDVRLCSAADVPDEAFSLPVPLKQSGKTKEDFCCIAISDNGSGMDKETLSQIFEPFFTTKPQGEGSGMGLSMAYGIVNNCGGWIAVESTPAKGSTFRLFLPDLKQGGEKQL